MSRESFIKRLASKLRKVDRLQSFLKDANDRIGTHKILMKTDGIAEETLNKSKQMYLQTINEAFIVNILINYSKYINIDVNFEENLQVITGTTRAISVDEVKDPVDATIPCDSPAYHGVIIEFSKEKNYGFIEENNKPNEFIFAHILCTEDEYVPAKGDMVIFNKILIPPENEKIMAVHVKLLYLAEDVTGESWKEAVEHDMEHQRPSRSDSNSFVHETSNSGDHIQHGNSHTN